MQESYIIVMAVSRCLVNVYYHEDINRDNYMNFTNKTTAKKFPLKQLAKDKIRDLLLHDMAAPVDTVYSIEKIYH